MTFPIAEGDLQQHMYTMRNPLVLIEEFEVMAESVGISA
jgi:hypothetical protein